MSLFAANVVDIGFYTDRPPLHFALERRLDDVVIYLVGRGAKITENDGFFHPTVLHTAARYHPAVLEDLIEVVGVMDASKHDGKSMRQLLQIRDNNGFDVLSLLLAEGSKKQLPVVDKLRLRYDIDLDAMKIDIGKHMTTLTGAVIIICIAGELVPLTQLRYLLNLKPRPKFICTDSGKTLLTLAVSGPLSCWCSSSLLTALALNNAQTKLAQTTMGIRLRA
jgi:hypothetical protein